MFVEFERKIDAGRFVKQFGTKEVAFLFFNFGFTPTSYSLFFFIKYALFSSVFLSTKVTRPHTDWNIAELILCVTTDEYGTSSWSRKLKKLIMENYLKI